MVVYQVYPRSFQDSDGDGEGDLRGIAQRLDHLAWLGVDALWLSPIYRSPMADGGYDVADYTDVDPRFGTLDDIDALATAVHARGMKLLLDVVPCHTSIEHPWFRAHPERYIWAPTCGAPNNWRSAFGGPAWSRDPHGRGWYLHSFYPEQPDLDWRRADVRDAFADILRFWRARGADGFRLDALQQLMKDPELRDDAPAEAPPPFPGDAERAALAHDRSSDAPDTPEALAALRAGAGADAFLVGEVFLPTARLARYLEHLDAVFCFELFFSPWEADALAGAITSAQRAGRLAWVLGNHDFSRVATRLGAANARAAAVLLLTLPGDAFVYQGDEVGQPDGPDHGLDRAGRDPFRAPMPWDEVAAQREDPASLLHLHRELIALRRTLDGPVADLRAEDGVLSFRRGDHVVAINTADAPRGAPAHRGIVLATHPDVDEQLLPGAGLIGHPA